MQVFHRPEARFCGSFFPRLKAGACGLLLTAVAVAATGKTSSTQLAELSLEQLSDIVVGTVSRFDERLDGAAASVYIITADDIRRSGATTLPQVLRLAPTLDIARADSSRYAVSARGFTDVLANKTLVLIDGRTVYTPLFSGVFWEAQDVVLEDIERIEVITGPSTALWGSNAVNCLIHVITREAAATQSSLAQARIGNREHVALVRQGIALGETGHMRAYAKAYDRDASRRADGSPVNDSANGLQIGFRADWALLAGGLTVQGDVYQGELEQPTSARKFSGVNLLARWEQQLSAWADLTVQGHAERTRREHRQTFRETLDTVDLVGELSLRPLDGHRVLVGVGVRQSHDRVTNSNALVFVPATRELGWTRLFLQDQITLTPALAATASVSVEKNPYTGTEVLPSVRLAWRPDVASLAWGALSRAVRAPSRIDRDLFQPAQPPYILAGGSDFQSEVSNVLELGWRAQPTPELSYSITLFHHDHGRLRSVGPTAQGPQFQNGIEGRTRGVEAWSRWRALPHWRLAMGMVQQRQALGVRAGAVDVGGLRALGNDPRYWWSVRSSLDVTPRLSWDLSLRRVGARPQPYVGAYTAVDTRLAWSALPTLEVALMLHNVADPGHAEWGAPANRVELQRSAQLQLNWRH